MWTPRSGCRYFLEMIRSFVRTSAPALVAIAVLAGVSVGATGTAEAVDGSRSRDEVLQLNPRVSRGRLANGMDYFILGHQYPANLVSFRLVVDAGSLQETDRQRGLAHFVEHMAFNGTRDFGETELVAYLEGLGIRFGPEVNAYTSFDETVYKLEVPSDDPQALETGVHVMAQWANYVTFEPEAVERERGVIVEEWRRGRGASQRMFDTHVPVLFAGSLYAERLPIGDIETIRTAQAEDLQAYYRRWYRPDNMAFIAVGDVDPGEIERLIDEYLGALERPAQPLQRLYDHVDRHRDLTISVADDPEATRSTVSIYTISPPAPFQTKTDYRALLTRALFTTIINERVRDISRDTAAPLFGGGIGRSRFLRSADVTVVTGTAKEGRVEETLALLVREIRRAAAFGVTDDETRRARERLLAWIDEIYTNRRTTESAVLADELVRYILEGEASPGIEREFELYNEIVPQITLREINGVAEEFVALDNAVILASLREADRSADTESRLRRALTAALAERPEPPEERSPAQTLMETRPEPGSATRISHDASTDVYRYELSNGASLFVKSTDFAEDELVLRAYSPGGLSLVPDEQVATARLSVDVLEESGLGALDRSDLEKVLTGSSASLSADIYSASEELAGEARAADAEDLFQLVYLTFTAPRFTDDAVERVRERGIESIRASERDPEAGFYRRVSQTLANGDPRSRPLDETDYRGLRSDRAAGLFRERFADPGDFSFFLVGSMAVDDAITMAERYLAAIPAPEQRRMEGVADPGYRPIDSGIRDDFRAGFEDRAQTVLLYLGEYEWSREENHRFTTMVDVLDIRLREEIREESGGSYGIGAGGYRIRRPFPEYLVQIAFGFDPARREELEEQLLATIDEIRRNGPDESIMARVRAQQIEQYERSMKRNAYWASVLRFAVEHGRELETILDYPELINATTGEEVRAVANRYLVDERTLWMTLLPAVGGAE